MARRVLLHESRESDGGRRIDLRVDGIPPGQPVGRRLIVVHSNQPLWTVDLLRERVGDGCKLHDAAVDTGSRISAKLDIKWSAGPAKIAQGRQIQIKPRIPGE